MISTSSRWRFAAAASPFALAVATTPAIAAGPAVTGAASAATAQQPAATTDPSTTAEDMSANQGSIVITGIRASIRNSVNQKRNNSSIVEVVSAEDIGKLPDSSIAETLARLPGLTAVRLDGRASQISVRGLASDFTTTTLNGRELASTENNRAVEYDQFPSELINGAVVYKTTDASLVSQAVGGTVDMLTIRPLAFGKNAIIVGFRGEYNDKGKLNPDTSAWGYRGNVTVVGHNPSRTLGWAVGYARTVQPIQEQWNHFWSDYSTQVGCASGSVAGGDCVKLKDSQGNDVDPTTRFLDGVKPYVKSNKLTRDGALGVLEFQPSDQIHLVADGFYSRFKDNQTLRGQEVAGYTAAGRQVTKVEGGYVTEGTWTGVHTMSRNDFDDRKAHTFALGLNAHYTPSSLWDFGADLSYSRAKRSFTANEVYATNAANRSSTGPGDNIHYVLNEGENLVTLSGSTIDYADSSWRLGDNLGWGGPFCTAALGWQCRSQDGYQNIESSTDDVKAIRLSALRELGGAFKSIEVGARYADRQKDHSREKGFLTLKDYPNFDAIPSDLLLSNPASLDFIGLGDTISFDARKLVASGIYNFYPDQVLGTATDTWTVNEKVFNAYAKLNIDAHLGSLPVTGNIGVQAVHTDQSSQGGAAQANPDGTVTVLDIDAGKKFWDFLPSLNLALGITDNQKVRLGVARVLARPRMDQMNAGRTFAFDTTKAANTTLESSPWSGSGGNPYLEPWRSWQFDVSYEAYFGKGGYVALAGFYKKLENWVYNQSVEADFTGLPHSGPIAPTYFQGLITSPANGEGGKIYGVELSASVPFNTFTDALDGFGFLGSASYTKSRVKETPDSDPIEMPGLSKGVINGTVYYQKYGFEARVSARHRSSFLTDIKDYKLDKLSFTAEPETIIDAQVSYDLTGVGVPGLTLYLQGSNLTDEPFSLVRKTDTITLPLEIHTYGRNFMFGATYKF